MICHTAGLNKQSRWNVIQRNASTKRFVSYTNALCLFSVRKPADSLFLFLSDCFSLTRSPSRLQKRIMMRVQCHHVSSQRWVYLSRSIRHVYIKSPSQKHWGKRPRPTIEPRKHMTIRAERTASYWHRSPWLLQLRRGLLCQAFSGFSSRHTGTRVPGLSSRSRLWCLQAHTAHTVWGFAANLGNKSASEA